MPQALNIVVSASPAVLPSLRVTRHPYTAPATMFTAPPRAAEAAPSLPHRSAAASVRTAVAMICQRSTVWKGLKREAKPFNYSGRASGASKTGAPQHRLAGEAFHQPLQLVEARVIDHDRPAAARAWLEVNRGTERFGQVLLQAAAVGVQPRSHGLPLARRAGSLLHQALGLAHRQPFGRHTLCDLDLARLRKGEQRARMAHVDGAVLDHRLHRRGELEQAQQVGHAHAGAPDRG